MRARLLGKTFQIMKVGAFTKGAQSLNREDGSRHHFGGKHSESH